jgi:hypothetical protein
MKARYKSSEPYFELYNDYYTNFQVDSVFLNAGSVRNQGTNTKFWDEANLRRELVQYLGNEQGLVGKDGENQLARIPSAKQTLAELEENHKRYQQSQKNLGFETTDYSSNELDKKLKLEALIDVMTGECEAIQNTILNCCLPTFVS